MKREYITDKILLKVRELPPLPTVVQKLMKVMKDERSSASDVTRILSSDQALAGKVLKLANSSFYGQSGEVATITRAVVILGFSTVRNLAMGLGICEKLAKMADDVDLDRFWDHSIACAAAATTVATRMELPDPEEAFIAGLLHDVGHLVLNVAVPDEYVKIEADSPEDQLEREKKALGITHTQVGRKLARHWHLPEPLGNSVRFHHTLKVATSCEEPLVTLVTLADALAAVHGSAMEGSHDMASVSQVARAAGLKLDIDALGLADMEQEIANTRVFLQVASGGETESAPPVSARNDKATVALIGSDVQRARWLKGALEHFGHATVSMKAFLAQGEDARAVDLVLLDPLGLPEGHLVNLKAFIKKVKVTAAVLTDGGGSSPPPLDTLTAIPFLFSNDQLLRLLAVKQEVPVA